MNYDRHATRLERHAISTLRKTRWPAIAALCVASAAQAVPVTSTWVGGRSGNWSVASNWSPAGVPNNGVNNYTVVIDNNSLISAFVSMNFSPTIDALTVTAGDQLSFPNDFDLRLNAIANDGVISLNSTGGHTDLLINAGSTSLSGAGSLVMGPNGNDRITGAFFDIDLVNGPGHTIRGAGQISINVIDLVNHGLVQADQTAAPLTLDLRNGTADNINDGIMQATAGGTLNILNSAIDNSLGLLRANTGSFVDLNGATIMGGELTTVGTGLVRATGNSTLNGITNSGHFSILNDVDPSLSGTIINQGLITLESTGGNTDLLINSNPTTLTGNGELVMGNNLFNRISGNFFDIDLINAAGHTIRGAGQIGINVIDMVNNGLIQADQPATSLQFDLRNGFADNRNNGTMEAVGGANMTFLNTPLDNSLGTIRAQNASTVDFSGANILGGLLTTVGSGQMRVTANSTFTTLTNSGNVSVLNDVDPTMAGTITNQGTITLGSTGGHTDLLINTNPTTFTGNGALIMGDHINNRISGSFFDIDLVNAAGHTIRGAGQIGINVIDMVNNGLIQADQPANPLQFDLRNGFADNFNNAAMEAINGATMTLLNTAIDNSLGTIRAQNGSFVDLNGANILGGVLTTVGTGQMRITANSTLNTLTNTGNVTVLNDVDPTMAGTITNQGTISLASTGGHTDLLIDSNPTTLAGAGQLIMGSHPNNRINGNFFDIDLVNAAGHTIRGGGQIGLNVIDITNQGSIIADDAAGLSIDQRNDFTNQGLLAVVDDGAMTIQLGPFTTSGTVQIDATRTLTRLGDYNQTAGVTTVHGALALSGGSVNLSGGALKGNGSITGGSVSNSGGTVSPGASPGKLNIQGGYNQTTSGAMLVELAGVTPVSGYDQLTVSGTASLAGTLFVSKLGGFSPPVGTQFTILTAGSVVGQFERVVPCTSHQLSYTVNSVILTIVPATAPADLNCDGHVNGLDLAILLSQWGTCSSSICTGDLNGTATVNGLDLAMLLAAWG